MLIFAIDDEPKMLRLLHKAIEEAAPGAEIRDFSLGSAALAAIEEEKLQPSVIFTDIQMPKLDGLNLAVKIKTVVPDTKIVFVTGYGEYALEAYRLHASGYVMKPVDAQRIREELNNVAAYLPEISEKLQVRWPSVRIGSTMISTVCWKEICLQSLPSGGNTWSSTAGLRSPREACILPGSFREGIIIPHLSLFLEFRLEIS